MTDITHSKKFLSLLESHKGILLKVSRAYVKDKEMQKDLVQEIILQLWKSFSKYDPRFKWSTWMYRIALNVSISYSITARNRRKHDQQWITFQTTSGGEEEDSTDEIRLKWIYDFIHQLKELDRAVVLLYLEGKPHKEIGEILGITPTNISTKLNRIKMKMKHQFQKEQKT